MTTSFSLLAEGITDRGSRPNNEDAWGPPPQLSPDLAATKGYLYIVADGIGGNEAGEIASEKAVQVTRDVYYRDPNREVRASLTAAIQEANRQIYRQAMSNPAQYGMGTTITAVVIRGNELFVANVGDSRTYWMGNGNGAQVSRISQDHTWVNERVQAGVLTQQEADSHPQRNVITRSLGESLNVQVDVFGPYTLSAGDQLLLCSDGLSDVVNDPEITAILAQHPPKQAVHKLLALAKQRGAPDNVTIVVIKAAQGNPAVRRAAAGTGKVGSKVGLMILGMLGLVVLLGGGVLGLQTLSRGNGRDLPAAASTETPVTDETVVTAMATSSSTLQAEPSETTAPLKLIAPVTGDQLPPGQQIGFRWWWRGLPENYVFQVIIQSTTSFERKEIDGDGLTHENELYLKLEPGEYRWKVIVKEEIDGKREERWHSSWQPFTVQRRPTAAPSPIPPTATSVPTDTPEPQEPSTPSQTPIPPQEPQPPPSREAS